MVVPARLVQLVLIKRELIQRLLVRLVRPEHIERLPVEQPYLLARLVPAVLIMALLVEQPLARLNVTLVVMVQLVKRPLLVVAPVRLVIIVPREVA